MNEYVQPSTDHIDHEPTLPDGQGGERTQAELKALFSDSTYLCRVVRVKQDMRPSINVIEGLRQRYGNGNVVVSLISIDPDTELLGTTPGRLGVWVKTDAKNKIDNEQL